MNLQLDSLLSCNSCNIIMGVASIANTEHAQKEFSIEFVGMAFGFETSCRVWLPVHRLPDALSLKSFSGGWQLWFTAALWVL